MKAKGRGPLCQPPQQARRCFAVLAPAERKRCRGFSSRVPGQACRAAASAERDESEVEKEEKINKNKITREKQKRNRREEKRREGEKQEQKSQSEGNRKEYQGAIEFGGRVERCRRKQVQQEGRKPMPPKHGREGGKSGAGGKCKRIQKVIGSAARSTNAGNVKKLGRRGETAERMRGRRDPERRERHHERVVQRDNEDTEQSM